MQKTTTKTTTRKIITMKTAKITTMQKTMTKTTKQRKQQQDNDTDNKDSSVGLQTAPSPHLFQSLPYDIPWTFLSYNRVPINIGKIL